jgi:Lon protease-like protein
LPLNIFEPRYLNMINDALGGHRMIGMIQPDPAAGSESEVFRTGCAGRITQYRETADCRIEMVLTGVCRFDLVEELSTTRGYRMIVPDWSRFSEDYADISRPKGSRPTWKCCNACRSCAWSIA